MAILNGTYYFNSVYVDVIGPGWIGSGEAYDAYSITGNFNFTSNNQDFSYLTASYIETNGMFDRCELLYGNSTGASITVGTSYGFSDDNYRYVTFDNAECSDEIYSFITNNTTKIPDYKISGRTLNDIAGAIRTKTGTSNSILAADFATKISEIETGGGGSVHLQTNKTVDPSESIQYVLPDPGYGYDGLEQVTVNAAPLEIVANVMPGTEDQDINPSRNKYGLRRVTVKGDSNLTSDSIKFGSTIFNVSGNHEGLTEVGIITPGTEPKPYDARQSKIPGYLSFTVEGDPNLTSDCIAHNKSIFSVDGEYVGDLVSPGDITPTTSDQTFTPSEYTFDPNTGAKATGFSEFTVKGDENLKSENIANGVSIFNVPGTYTGSCNHNLGYYVTTLSTNGTHDITFNWDEMGDHYNGASAAAITVAVPSYGYGTVSTIPVRIKNNSNYDITCVYAVLNSAPGSPPNETDWTYFSADIASTGITPNSDVTISTYEGSTIYYIKSNGQFGTITASGGDFIEIN